ncbi:MAG: CotS family spore coat protein [Acetivibrionales bacterium]|jgi:CotS family spore coat protein
MPSIEHEPLDTVLGRYNINVIDIRNESYKEKKGVWRVKTSQGNKILKKVSYSEETLWFIMDAVRHLCSNGVRIPGVSLTSEGKEYVYIGGACYILSDAIEGRNPRYSSPRELDMIAGGLANFHKASKGFIPSQESKPKYHLGLWIEDYTARVEEIKALSEKYSLAHADDTINSIILKEMPHFYERASRAIELLKGKEYEDWVNEARQTGCLCHQDFAAGNLILSPSGDLYVLDTDSITMDIAARDIRKLLNKVMKKAGKWDAALVSRILERYQAVNPLTPRQWEVVRLDLLFPHLFVGAVNKYYYKRDKEWNNEKYKQRIVEMAALEKTAEPVLENFKSIIP